MCHSFPVEMKIALLSLKEKYIPLLRLLTSAVEKCQWEILALFFHH